MISRQVTLDKKAYPLMMHLSILPKYDFYNDLSSDNPASISGMNNSWCIRSSSTLGVLTLLDDDRQEDD